MSRELEGPELTLTTVGVSILSRTAGYIFLNSVLLQKTVLASDSSLVWKRVKRDNLFLNHLFMPQYKYKRVYYKAHNIIMCFLTYNKMFSENMILF
jgi:hypothetical protein